MHALSSGCSLNVAARQMCTAPSCTGNAREMDTWFIYIWEGPPTTPCPPLSLQGITWSKSDVSGSCSQQWVEHGWTSWLNLGGAAHVQAEERRAELLHLWDVTLPVCCQQPNVTPTSTPPDVVQRQETTLTEAVEYHTESRFCHSSSQPLPTTEKQPAAARGRQVLDTLEHWQLDEVRKKCLGGTREPHCNWFTQSKWTLKSLDGAELECKK